ncbi:hypothetical protein CHS0354_017242 [Potamilus streckersoni]|uniref:Uncharacterized protein n=1 Tax=Potamilus streckersoni TaxID=2493646 RepID=A0AAE0RYV9_9BIVA|nr:hypothetical protein CHS0354_017242 [Potamilus streckersoni]
MRDIFTYNRDIEDIDYYIALFKRTRTSLTFNAYKQQETHTKAVIKQAKLTSWINYCSNLKHHIPHQKSLGQNQSHQGKSLILTPRVADTQDNRERAEKLAAHFEQASSYQNHNPDFKSQRQRVGTVYSHLFQD